MTLNTKSTLTPKQVNGSLNVLILGRISTPHQNEENIEASFRYVEEYLGRIYQGPLELKHLGERASGMLTDRQTIREAEDLIRTGQWDLVIAEDLSRIFRNPRHQYNFVQDAVDADTRVICIADNLDTGDEHWELMLGTAALRHGLVVSDTRRRVRRTATHAFHLGGMVLKIRYGYRRLTKEEADSGHFGPKGLAIAKRPECTPIIRHMRDRVLQGDSYAAIADWARDEGVEPPPYSTNGRWSGRLVSELLQDPILSGQRTFRRIVFEPIYRTGRHKRRANPEPEAEHYPELAHLSENEHQELIEFMLRRQGAHANRSGQDHPLYGRPRSRTIWPAQHARCAVCGRLMYRYDRDQLKCSSAHARAEKGCWNHVQVSCELVRRRVLPWILSCLKRANGFHDVLADAAQLEWDRLMARTTRGDNSLARNVEALEGQAQNLTKAIAMGGRLDPLVQQLNEVEASISATRRQLRSGRQRQQSPGLSIRCRVMSDTENVLHDVAGESFEFAELMRQAVTSFTIQPVQAIDTGLVRPRGYVTFSLSAWRSATQNEISTDAGVIESMFDLFEPPIHIRVLAECVKLRRTSPQLSLKKLASELGISHMTVKRSLDYHRRMEREGLSEPYRVLETAPPFASRWSRRC